MQIKTVYVKIKNYTPYFFIKLPERWSISMAKMRMKRLYTYFSEGNLVISTIEDYNSHNTTILDVNEVKKLLKKLPEIKNAF